MRKKAPEQQCRKCKCRPPAPGRTTCMHCLLQQRKYQRQYNERKKTGTVSRPGRPSWDSTPEGIQERIDLLEAQLKILRSQLHNLSSESNEG